jgi:hypothetical protein
MATTKRAKYLPPTAGIVASRMYPDDQLLDTFGQMTQLPMRLRDMPKTMNGLRIWYLSLKYATRMKVQPPTACTGTVNKFASVLLKPIARMI